MKGHNTYKKIIGCLFFVCFLASISGTLTADAKEKAENTSVQEPVSYTERVQKIRLEKGDVTVEIDYGMERYVRNGRYTSITAVVTNRGDLFSGTVRVEVPSYTGGKTIYEREIKVNAKGKQEADLNIPFDIMYNEFTFSLRNAKGNVIVEKKVRINVNYSNLAFVGVITNHNTDLAYLDHSDAKVFYMDEVTLPDNYWGLDILDVLIINEFDSEKFSSQQVKAILEWVEKGGSLVFGTGQDYKTTLKKFDTDVFSSAVEELERKITWENAEDNRESSALNHSGFFFSVEKQYSDIQIKNTALDMAEEENIEMQKVDLKKGNIQVFNTDFGIPYGEAAERGNNIRKAILSNLSSSRKKQMEKEYYGEYYPQGIFAEIGGKESARPKIGMYAVILGIYVTAAGPLLYIVLKKKDKRNYLWIGVPLCAGIFTAVIYGAGRTTRVEAPYIGYFSVTTLNGDSTAEEDTVFMMAGPDNDEYGFEVDQKYHIAPDTTYMGTVSNMGNGTETSGNMTIRMEKEKNLVQMSGYSAFSPVYFNSNVTMQVKGSFDSTLHFYEGEFTGTITNQLGYSLTNASVICSGIMIDLGTIENNQTIKVDQREQELTNSLEVVMSSDMIKKVTGYTGERNLDSKTAARRYAGFTSYLGNHMAYNSGECYLIGFTEQRQRESIMNQLGYEAFGTNMVVIPLKVDYSRDGTTYIPSMDQYIAETSGDFSYRYRFVENSGITVRYLIPEEDKIKKIEYTDYLNLDFNSGETAGFKGEISFYNVREGKYDIVFYGGTAGEVTGLEDYLDENNQLMVQYSPENRNGYVNTLPFLSAVKEGE